MGFPATASGIELKILRYLFSEDDAVMFLALSHTLETPESVASRLGQTTDDIAVRLDDMAERGLLFRVKKETGAKYGAIPFVHGLFEFQVKNLKRDLAEMVEQYFDEGFEQGHAGGRGLFPAPHTGPSVHRCAPPCGQLQRCRRNSQEQTAYRGDRLYLPQAHASCRKGLRQAHGGLLYVRLHGAVLS